ncbi:MAG: hypothetical protein AVDCRST_MAG61-1862, partial [uncultured Friedmanniella sp.]
MGGGGLCRAEGEEQDQPQERNQDRPAPACRAALTTASRVAATSALSRSSSGAS